MHFSQRALLCNRTEFDFGDTLLKATVDDGRLRISFSVPYPEIATKRSVKSFPEKAFKRLGLAVVLGALAGACVITADDPYQVNPAYIIVCLVALALILVFERYARFDATQIPLESGNTILVFHDHQHHVILGEMYRRRRAEIVKLHGTVDTLNHPQWELRKFLWLKEENIITESEFEEARLKIASSGRPGSGPY